MTLTSDSGSESDSGSASSGGSFRGPSPNMNKRDGSDVENQFKSDNKIEVSPRSQTPEVSTSRHSSPGSVKSRKSRSGSRSPTATHRSRSRSRSRTKSKSKSKSRSRSRSKSKSKSKSKSRSRSRSRSRSGSRSRSKSSNGSEKSHSQSKTYENENGNNSPRSHSRESSVESESHTVKSKSPDHDEEMTKRKHSSDEESDSENKKNNLSKKTRALIDSDSEEEENGVKKINDTSNKEMEPTADALFGDASDISTDEEKEKEKKVDDNDNDDDDDDDDVGGGVGNDNGKERRRSRSKSKSRSRSRSKSRSRSISRSRSRSRDRSGSEDERQKEEANLADYEDKEKEDEPEPPPETRIDVEIPKITTDLGKEIHFIKLPNFLSVETRPFDHETYEDEIDEEETLDEEGRARLKLKVENTIRWRQVFDDNGQLKKESNARFVKWSDGSISLYLGSEIFDVYKQPLQGDYNHLYIRQGTGLQGQSVFRTKLTFRPHSTESFTHRKMTMSLADRSQKTSGIKVLSQVGMNPDQNRYEMMKKEEEKLKMAIKVQHKSKKSTGGNRSSGRVGGSYNNDPYHDDGSDDEGAISLAAIKNKYKKPSSASKVSNIYSSDEDGSDFETTRTKKIKGKVLKDSDEEESNDATSDDEANNSKEQNSD